ncbi:MAG: glycosyltransferase family 4 protein [Muribaculaceae bacterium]|nr:glycosyltransferase family 4 protein [Muribaculaceae bacterium]
MKIVVVGTRGIPGVQGGIETHCEELYPRIVSLGHEVHVVCRSKYADARPDSYKGVRLHTAYAPSGKHTEAIVHTFFAVLKAWRLNADIVHIHAIGPSIMAPLARMLGMRVVMTNHGADYERKKWGRVARAALRAGEWLGTRFSDGIIAISEPIRRHLSERYGRTDISVIFNGVNAAGVTANHDYIDTLGLERMQYIVAIGRFVEEKGFDHLIDAFEKAGPTCYKLVIVGDADIDSEYSRHLKAKARKAGVVLTGFIKGERMRQLMSGAALNVMCSSHEGLPIALLEAMSYGLEVIVSDIQANRLPSLSDYQFYPSGNTGALAQHIATALAKEPQRRCYDMSMYNWDVIAGQTDSVYKKVLSKSYGNP